MHRELEVLIKLQSVEGFIAQREKDQEEIPKRIAELEGELERAKEELENAKSKKKEIALKRREKEKLLDELAEKIADRKGRLFKVKTNEEYAALLREIESFKEQVSSTEDEIIMLLDEDEGMDAVIEEAQRRVKEAERALEEKRAECKRLLEKVEKELEAARRERDELWELLSPRIKRLYEKLKNTKGTAVARAENQTCMGCFTELPPQTFLEVKKGETLVQCPFCGRILYFWQEKQGDEG